MAWIQAALTAVSVASSLFGGSRRSKQPKDTSIPDAVLRGVKSHLANVAASSPTYAWEHRERLAAGKAEQLTELFDPKASSEEVLTN